MKKVLTGMLALALLAGCSAGTSATSAASAASTGEKIVITAGISPDYPPYESLTTAGEIVGFDIDMAKLFEQYLSEEDGKEYVIEFIQMDFDNIITQIQGDQVQIGISGFTYADDRVVEWSEPYLGTAQVAIVPADSTYTKADELKDKHIAAQTGTTGEKAANELSTDATGMKNAQEIMNALSAHQFDGAIIDSGVAKEYANNGSFKILEGTLMDEKNYVIAKQGNTEIIEKINKCIAKFRASDDYKTLCEKHEVEPLSE